MFDGHRPTAPDGRSYADVERERAAAREAEERQEREVRRAHLLPQLGAAAARLEVAVGLEARAQARARGALRAALEAPDDDEQAIAAAIERAVAARAELAGYEPVLAALRAEVTRLEAKLAEVDG